MRCPTRFPANLIWHFRGNMLCDRTVTLAFDAVPESGAHYGG
jgi:hypothetical protein